MITYVTEVSFQELSNLCERFQLCKDYLKGLNCKDISHDLYWKGSDDTVVKNTSVKKCPEKRLSKRTMEVPFVSLSNVFCITDKVYHACILVISEEY